MPRPDDAPTRLRMALGTALGPPQILAFIPALTLGAFWLGGEPALIATALLLPVALALSGSIAQGTARAPRGRVTGVRPRQAVVDALDYTLSKGRAEDMTTACLALSIEGLDDLADRFGQPVAETATERVAERLATALRASDTIGRLGEGCFGIALGPVRRVDLEIMLQIAGRMQDAVRDPIPVDASAACLSCSIGFCLPSRSPQPKGAAMLIAAETALREAHQHGPGAIRAYSAEMKLAARLRSDLADEVADALETGQIRSWFQPQTSTDTGKIAGFEALARWPHPERGLIPPAEFLPVIEQAGLTNRLNEEILFHAFTALRSWDKAGLHVPTIGVNFSGTELRDPKLVDRIQWELDRFDLAPGRLTVEVLETVVSGSQDDMVARNIAALSQLGCGIDLDDFGTGHASIAAIRRFAINRLKIDRSFVTRVDQDREQQNLVAAILMMAERLGLETLAEGVERVGEHAMLAQLGCGFVQGYGIGRPMPFEDTIGWMRKHADKLDKTPGLGRQAG